MSSLEFWRKKTSLEPDLNQWPKDSCHAKRMCLQSSALPTELSRGDSSAEKINSTSHLNSKSTIYYTEEICTT